MRFGKRHRCRPSRRPIRPPDRFSRRELALCLDLHVIILQRQNSRIDQIRHRQRVVHRLDHRVRSSVQMFERCRHNFCRRDPRRILRRLQRLQPLVRKQHLARPVQPPPRQRPPRIKHNPRRLRVHIQIKLRRRRHIPARKRPAHNHDGLDFLRQPRIVAQRQPHIRQRPPRTPPTVNPFRSGNSRGTFPPTGVIASTCNSGERNASKIASASSTPGSVSMITRSGAAAGGAFSIQRPSPKRELPPPNFLLIRAAANAPTDPAKNSLRFGRPFSCDRSCSRPCRASPPRSWPMILLVRSPPARNRSLYSPPLHHVKPTTRATAISRIVRHAQSSAPIRRRGIRLRKNRLTNSVNYPKKSK